jgi:exonuclease SbcD
VAYPGSIGRFHYGEEGDKGYLLWSLTPGESNFRRVPVPARETVSVEFNGPPDMEELARVAANAEGAFVRVRWQVDEEHRQSVDRDAIEALFGRAAELKLEPRVLPLVRSRAQGISLETTVEAKVARWCEIASVETQPIVERLQLLHAGDAEAIAARVLAQLDQLPPPASEPSLAAVIGSEAQATLAGTAELAIACSASTASPVPASASLSWLTDDLFAA